MYPSNGQKRELSGVSISSPITTSPLEGYKKGQGQPSYDKQFVRNWLLANPDSDYLLPDDIINKTVEKYKEAYKLLTGEDF